MKLSKKILSLGALIGCGIYFYDKMKETKQNEYEYTPFHKTNDIDSQFDCDDENTEIEREEALDNDDTILRYASHELRNNFDVTVVSNRDLANEINKLVVDLESWGAVGYIPEDRSNEFFLQLQSGNVQEIQDLLLDIVKENQELPNIVTIAKTLLEKVGERGITKEQALEMVAKNGTALKDLPDFQDDEDVVMTAINQNVNALQFANERLRDDEEVFFSIIDKNQQALFYASDRLLDDKKFIMICVKKGAFCLPFVSDNLRNDKEVVLKAIEFEGASSIFYISERLKDDKEVIMKILTLNLYRNDIEFLLYVSDRLRDDPTVVLKAIERDYKNLEFASDRLRNNFFIVKFAIKNNPLALEFASDRFKDDYEFVQIAYH